MQNEMKSPAKGGQVAAGGENENQKPKSNSGVIIAVIIILVILIIVALGIGGYFIYKYYSNKSKTTATPTPTALVTVSPTPSPSISPTATATKKSSSSQTTISTDYVIAGSDSRVISESELKNLTPWELKVARNEIYARHGREFVHKDLQCYFASKSWYKKNSSFSESDLTKVEVTNISIILDYEKTIDSPLLQKDSGC